VLLAVKLFNKGGLFIFVGHWGCLASINSRSLVTMLLTFASFFKSLTLSAYLSVLRVFSHDKDPGETLAIIVVLLFPVRESFKTWVSLLPLKGVCFFSRSRARMHSFKARSDLLISAPSILVYRFWSIVSAPLSLPAKSMKDILPCSLYSLTFLSWNWRIA
jgi:hypothetical protein